MYLLWGLSFILGQFLAAKDHRGRPPFHTDVLLTTQCDSPAHSRSQKENSLQQMLKSAFSSFFSGLGHPEMWLPALGPGSGAFFSLPGDRQALMQWGNVATRLRA